jgi:hypothetical protein
VRRLRARQHQCLVVSEVLDAHDEGVRRGGTRSTRPSLPPPATGSQQSPPEQPHRSLLPMSTAISAVVREAAVTGVIHP